MVKTKEATLEAETKNVYEQMCRMIGTHINREREKKGISLREMYRRTNISIAVMSDIENGLKLPRIETLIKLLIELDIPLSDIFGSMAYQDFSTYKEIKNYNHPDHSHINKRKTIGKSLYHRCKNRHYRKNQK